MDGKLDCRRGQINALGSLVYLHDSKTKEKFLVDTGAAVSVLPHTSKDPSTGPPLSGADGKPIPSWGSVKKTLNFGVRAFLCTFILAAVSKPILGVDFLSANRLLVDPHFGQVLDANTLDPITGSRSAARRSGLAASLCHVTPAVRSLLSAFPAIVGDGTGNPNPKHGVFHSIETVAAVPLSHPTPGATLSLAVDASDSHVGGVLQQLENRAWRGVHLLSSHRNCLLHSPGIPPLTGSCLQLTLR
jgi:hypothetical protein